MRLKTEARQAQAKNLKYMEAILEQNYIAKETINRTSGAFGEKIGVLGSWFGCWHTQLSRPFTDYRTCLQCGARRHFNAETLKTFGAFHYPPTISPVSSKR